MFEYDCLFIQQQANPVRPECIMLQRILYPFCEMKFLNTNILTPTPAFRRNATKGIERLRMHCLANHGVVFTEHIDLCRLHKSLSSGLEKNKTKILLIATYATKTN